MIGEIAKKGNRLETLEALRDHIAETIEAGVNHRDLAPLARRLESLVAEIDALKEFDGDDLDNELERRRLEKQGGVAGAKAAGS